MIDASTIDTTELAAVAARYTIQGFFTSLPHLDSQLVSRTFNLWTESVFYKYFSDQNDALAKGNTKREFI